MNLEGMIDGLAAKAEHHAFEKDGDYRIGGLLYCGICNEAKQCVINIFGKERIVGCACKCVQDRIKAEEEEKKRRERLERISKLRASGIHDENIRNWTFDKWDDSNLSLKQKAHTYYDKWKKMHDENIGLLLFGNVGTGKTFVAACIANALIDDGVPVLMTNFSKLLNDLSGYREEDKNGYIASLNNFELLIIDDLGVERQSDYALEQVYNIIDSRYKNGQPLIVTTNLSIEDLKNPKDMKYKRIYDRILEMTIPIKVDGVSRREQLHRNKLELAKELFAD